MTSDAEVVARFMEQVDANSLPAIGEHVWSQDEWWECGPNDSDWTPTEAGLDRLRLVEAKLKDGQWHEYIDLLCGTRSLGFMVDSNQFDYADGKALIHAEAPAKIRALATVLRESVEKEESE